MMKHFEKNRCMSLEVLMGVGLLPVYSSRYFRGQPALLRLCELRVVLCNHRCFSPIIVAASIENRNMAPPLIFVQPETGILGAVLNF
jgi:hypothetical protein